MLWRLTLVAIFFLVGFQIRSQQFNEVENALIKALYHFDFDTYDKVIHENKSRLDNSAFRALKEFLRNQGYSKKTDSVIASELLGSENIISQIAFSKYHLYNSRRSDTTYFLLYNSYNVLKERGLSRDLTKLSLLSFLDYYARETTFTEDTFRKYLIEFESLCQSVEDFAWLYFYKNLFEGRSVNSTAKKYRESGIVCKNFYESNKKRLNSAQKASLLENLVNHERLNENEKGLLNYIVDIDSLGELTFTKINRFNVYLDAGAFYAKQKDYNKASAYFEKSFAMINRSDSILGIVSYNKFKSFYYYASKKEYEEAYNSLNKAYNLGRKLNYEENAAKISERKVILETTEKEKQILIEQQRAIKNRNWLIAASLALILGGGIAILLQKNTTKKRQLAEQEAVLKQQRVENLLKEQELVSIDAMIAGQEKERKRVAGELHDDLGSLMATIKLHLDNVKVDNKDPSLQNAEKLLDEAYQKIRGMAHSKNSGVMSDQGLLAAINKMAKTITDTSVLDVSVENFGLGERMENSLELSIFRIIQELVANAIKHAEASKVNIQLTQHEDNLNIIVEDNGKGFDRSKLDKHKTGMGLTTIEKRVEHLEGNFTVDSILGKGTSILIDIPI